MIFVTSFDRRMSGVAEVTLPNREAYCQRHGYRHVVFERWGQWGKVEAVLEALELGDDLFFLDIDAVVAAPDTRLEPLLVNDLVLTRDQNGLNTAAFLAKPRPWVRTFFRRVLEARTSYVGFPNGEQPAIAHLLWCEELSSVTVLPQRAMNSYCGAWYGLHLGEAGEYREGDFVLHAAALDNGSRVWRLTEFLKKTQL